MSGAQRETPEAVRLITMSSSSTRFSPSLLMRRVAVTGPSTAGVNFTLTISPIAPIAGTTVVGLTPSIAKAGSEPAAKSMPSIVRVA